MVRIGSIEPLAGFRVRLKLTDGAVAERDLEPHLNGRVFQTIRADRSEFVRVRVEAGALVWPNGADLCADMVIHGGLPPRSAIVPGR